MANRSGYAWTASSAIWSSFGPQLGGWITAASMPPSFISATASSVVNDVTWRWAMLLGRPPLQMWIWASTMRMTYPFVRLPGSAAILAARGYETGAARMA